MKSGSLISIIIPVFNTRPFLAEVLDSVIKQTYQNLEIIIVDDGSTDGSGEICDAYAKKDKRVRVVHQENKGLSSARNAGLDIMSGDAVAFVDSDDACHPDYIGAMAAAMIREQPELVVCRYTTHKTNGKMVQTGREKTRPSIGQGSYDRAHALYALVDSSLNHGVWNKLYKKELWETVRFPDGHVYEDTDTVYQIIDQCRTVYALDRALYLYRNRPGSIVNTGSWKNTTDGFLASEHFDSFVEANTPELFSNEYLQKSHQACLIRMISLYCRYSVGKGEKKEGLEELRRKVVEAGKEKGIETCGLPAKASYWMIRSCPSLVNITYPVFCFLQSLG